MFNTTTDEEKKLENEALENLERQQRALKDRANSEQAQQDENDYQALLHTTNSDYMPKTGETMAHYAIRYETIADQHYQQNWRIHVEVGTKGHAWHTHRDPRGCFMCDDILLLHMTSKVFNHLAKLHPTDTF